MGTIVRHLGSVVQERNAESIGRDVRRSVARDLNLLLGIFFLSACAVVVINLAVDIVYTLLDPRIEVV